MPVLYLVRHGQAAAGYGDDPDPGLGDEGRAQALVVADTLAPLGPLPILVSPLRRCRETAEPLAQRWEVAPHIEPDITEVAAPVDDLAGRSSWLRDAMVQRWPELEPAPRRWRERLLARLVGIDTDTVLVTHFVAVNAALGAALDDDRFLVERLANASITTLEQRDGRLHLLRSGAQGASEVL
jgi:broad specificity phosphatase PhoE